MESNPSGRTAKRHTLQLHGPVGTTGQHTHRHNARGDLLHSMKMTCGPSMLVAAAAAVTAAVTAAAAVIAACGRGHAGTAQEPPGVLCKAYCSGCCEAGHTRATHPKPSPLVRYCKPW
jgi:hypothetical protein